MRLISMSDLVGLHTLSGWAEWTGPSVSSGSASARHMMIRLESDAIVEFQQTHSALHTATNRHPGWHRDSDCHMFLHEHPSDMPHAAWLVNIPRLTPVLTSLRIIDHVIPDVGVYSLLVATDERDGHPVWEVGVLTGDDFRRTYHHATYESCVLWSVL